MAKSGKAFRTIGEAEAILGVQQHLLRYWESQIAQIQPVRREGRSRLYRPDDLQLIAGIKKLIQEDGLTIRAVQKTLKAKGIAYVSELNPVNLDSPAPEPGAGATEPAKRQKSVSRDSSETSSGGQTSGMPPAEPRDSADGKQSAAEQMPLDIDSLSRIYSRLEKLRQRMESAARSL